jgi:predicted DsbA family dithiol-disulfide isomerase
VQGKRRLDAALDQLEGSADFQVVYHAFVIDHGTAAGGEECGAYNRRRWGGDGWTGDLRHRGRPDGAAFANWVWWPNSVRAHQLLLLAQREGKGREAKELLLSRT